MIFSEHACIVCCMHISFKMVLYFGYIVCTYKYMKNEKKQNKLEKTKKKTLSPPHISAEVAVLNQSTLRHIYIIITLRVCQTGKCHFMRISVKNRFMDASSVFFKFC